MKTISTLFLFLISFVSISQITYEKGYFIDNQNLRTDCFIKNYDWKNNPTEFEFKLTADSDPEKRTIATVKEFGVSDLSRHVRANATIDISSDDLDKLSNDRNPEWSRQLIFLKVLIEGKVTLYYYEKDALIRFFYSLSDTAIKQLVYKEYYASDKQVAENFKFREQLWNDVRIENANMNSVEQISYNLTELVRYFKKFYTSKGESFLIYGEKNKKRESFHLRVTPGINYSSVNITNVEYPDSKTDLGEKINFRIGIEAEFILPFNKNKWGISIEPSYQSFISSGQQGSFERININYQSVEFPLALRHYFFLNKNTKLFINAAMIPGYSFVFGSKVNKHDIGTSISYAFGLGAEHKKWSTEMRYYTNRDLLKDYFSMKNNYQRFAFIVGFRLL